jgi:hypothetical protein
VSPADLNSGVSFVAQELSANPFRPGNGVLPAYLAGREWPLAEFDAFIADPHPLHANWTVTGLRGTGKTVLVETAAARAEAAGWLTLEGCGKTATPKERVYILLDSLSQADIVAVSLPELTLEQSVARGARLLRPARISVAGVSFRPEPLTARAPADRMRDALVRLSDALADAGRAGALLLYDEAHLLADDRSRERYPLSSFLAALGGVQRTGEPRVRVVLTGLPTLSVNLKRARTYAERMFRHVVLANLERGDAWDALTIPLARTSRRFATAVVGEIVEATGGYPYFLQFFGAYIWPSVPAAEVTTAAYRAIEPGLLHELDLAFFDDRFQVATPAEQAVLIAMAREHGRVDLKTIREALVAAPAIAELVSRLIDRGLIFRETRGAYDFALPLFRAYLRRRAEITGITASVISARGDR